MMILNKKNILFLILESKNDNCTESIYLKYVNKNYNLKHNLIVATIGNNPTKDKIIQNIRVSNNLYKIIVVKDNDTNELNDSIYKRIKKTIEKYFISKKYFIDDCGIPNFIDDCGIPKNDFSFDHFLLMHYDEKTFLKNKNDPQNFFRKKINLRYKAMSDLPKKILDEKKSIENLFDNSKYDDNYKKLSKEIWDCSKVLGE